MASVTVELDKSLNCSAVFALFEKVKNAHELKEKILKGELEASLLKADLIVDAFQLSVAVNKAVHSLKTEQMKTRNVFAEVLYNLSPSKNIFNSLKTFGIDSGDSEILVMALDNHKFKEVSSMVVGVMVSLENLASYTDVSKVKKIYNIKDEELVCSSLSDSVITRMAVKDFVKKI